MENFLMISNVALWAVIIIQSFVIFMLVKLVVDFLNRFRNNGGTSGGITQLQPGNPAPPFREEDQHGNMLALADYRGKHTLLLFTMSSCQHCKAILSKLDVLKQAHAHIEMVVISGDPDHVDTAGAQDKIPATVPYLRSPDVMKNYFVEKIPAFALIDGEGKVVVAEEVSSYEQLEKYLTRQLRKAG